MMAPLCQMPDRRLKWLVRAYWMWQIDLGTRSVHLPVIARTQVTLDFYVRRSNIIESRRSGAKAAPPPATIVGPQTGRNFDVQMSGNLDIFRVEFAPTALHALFGTPMSDLTDQAIAAGEMWGCHAIDTLYERLSGQSTFTGRVAVMEEDLLNRAPAETSDCITYAAAAILSAHGNIRMNELTQLSHLSSRHFNRLFTQRVGVAPKTYARIARLHSAIAAKSARPEASWAEIAHEFEYFDQAHLNKEFRSLADATPTTLVLPVVQDRNVRQRLTDSPGN